MEQMLSWVLVHHCLTRQRRDADLYSAARPADAARSATWAGFGKALRRVRGLSR